MFVAEISLRGDFLRMAQRKYRRSSRDRDRTRGAAGQPPGRVLSSGVTPGGWIGCLAWRHHNFSPQPRGLSSEASGAAVSRGGEKTVKRELPHLLTSADLLGFSCGEQIRVKGLLPG